jgi:hypothetical protein
MYIENKCIICEKEANAKNSHIVPMNLIKDCVGSRNNEISYDIDILNKNQIESRIYIGDNLKHNKDEINNENLEINDVNPYTLDNILCSCCEMKLGKIEGRVYSEIILKIRDEKYQNNFRNVNVNNFDLLIPNTNKISKVELDIYFYSIILRVIKSLKPQDVPVNVVKKTVDLIANFLNHKIYGLSEYNEQLKTGLIIYITNNPKSFPTFLESNKFEKLIIPVCQFFIMLENNTVTNPFGNCMNNITDDEFKFIKNSEILDKELFSVKNILK